MKETLIRAALDWPSQRSDFEPDGSLRDLYIQNTSADDWKIALSMIVDGEYGACLERDNIAAPIPANFEALFDWNGERHSMSFTVGSVGLSCHFFTPTEIEFSFRPNDVTEAALHDLLAFMIDVGDATKKQVIMTPENGRHLPMFSYDSDQSQLRWISPSDNRH